MTGRTMPMNGANLGESSESAMIAACGARFSTMTEVYGIRIRPGDNTSRRRAGGTGRDGAVVVSEAQVLLLFEAPSQQVVDDEAWRKLQHDILAGSSHVQIALNISVHRYIDTLIHRLVHCVLYIAKDRPGSRYSLREA